MTVGHVGAQGLDHLEHASIAMEELVRRAKLQAGELNLLIQRLEQLRREIDQHLYQVTG